MSGLELKSKLKYSARWMKGREKMANSIKLKSQMRFKKKRYITKKPVKIIMETDNLIEK